MTDIEIEIDGQKLTAKPNQTVIQVADDAGIYIPRFCYHKHLSIPANCRMCLVEIEKAPKTMPACATPVAPGMKVFTKSAKTIAAQRSVMEFLLINHPLDCPICDQGGECELQDLSMGYGAPDSKYTECKRAVADDNLGPLIATEMTRCILCSRCIRFGEEIAGQRELGMTFRGEFERVTTFVEHAMHSEVSGNIIDLCPVGALTSRPYRFTARPWELDQAPSISPHDCLGTNINVHTRYGEVMRVVSRENDQINQTWLSDRDRFSYTGLNHPDRLTAPMIKTNGEWQVVDWRVALDFFASNSAAVIAEHGADKLGALASPNSTLEEFYLLQKLIRELGSPHIDHRLREVDHRDQQSMPLFPGMSMPLSALETCDAVLLIGSNLQREQPLAALRLRKAILKGATVSIVNPVDYEFNFRIDAKHIVAPHLMIASLSSIIDALENKPEVADIAKNIATQLKNKSQVIIILGASALASPEAAIIRQLAKRIAALTNAKINYMTSGANSAGGWIAGAIPHRHAGGVPVNHVGLDAYAMLHKPRKAYVLLNVEPDYDMAHAALAGDAIKQAQFVTAIAMYRNPILEAHADVILPMTAFTESAGTYVNVCGEWQTVKGVAKPIGEARPAWKILRVMGNFLNLNGFDYQSSDDVLAEVKSHLTHNNHDETLRDGAKNAPPQGERAGYDKLSRVGDIPFYATDSIVRRSEALQKAQTILEGDLASVRIHPETAKTLKLHDNEMVRVKQHHYATDLPVSLDTRVAPFAVHLFGGTTASIGLGDLYGDIELEKVRHDV